MINLKSQSGRSMVEMLGVLSIISVLSVGGINAYSTAIKKHKANELLKQASMHAVEVSSQIMSGKEPTGLSDFGTSIAIRLNTTNLNGKTTFKLILSDIDGDVCEQLKSMKGGMVRDATCDGTTATLTYYKNLATNDVEGAKSPTNEKVDIACKDVECEEGQECIGGSCASITGECSNNSDCTSWCDANNYEKCYCSITATPIENPEENYDHCWKVFNGTCAQATINNVIDKELGYISSAEKITWWSSVNFCKAHNKSMLYLADFGFTGGFEGDGQCHGSECTGTFKWSDLKNKFGESFYWLLDPAENKDGNKDIGSSNNSCWAFYMHTQYSNISHRSRRNLDTYVLCK